MVRQNEFATFAPGNRKTRLGFSSLSPDGLFHVHYNSNNVPCAPDGAISPPTIGGLSFERCQALPRVVSQFVAGRGGRILTEPVAGTCPRADGSTKTEILRKKLLVTAILSIPYIITNSLALLPLHAALHHLSASHR